MFSIVFDDEYTVAPRLLAELRQGAGLSQRVLPALLDRSDGHVQRMETGQRPVDARAAGVDHAEAPRDFPGAWEQLGLTYSNPGNTAGPPCRRSKTSATKEQPA